MVCSWSSSHLASTDYLKHSTEADYLKHSTEADELSRLGLAGSYPSVDRIPLRCLLCSNCAQVPPSRLRRSSRLRCADQSRQRCCSARRRSASCAQRFALRPSAESPCGSC